MENQIQKFKEGSKRTKLLVKVRKIFATRVFFYIFLILLQIFAIFYAFSKLPSALVHSFRTSGILVILFILYVTNTSGKKEFKNEFKIGWIFLILISPVFGTMLYVFHRHNPSEFRLKRRLKQIFEYSKNFIPSVEIIKSIGKEFSEVASIGKYLYNQGNFCPVADCSTKYYSCGEDFFVDVLKDLKKAKKFIFLEFFIIEPSEIEENLIEILQQKVKEGVEVRILFDSVGSIAFSNTFLKYHYSSLGIKTKIWLKLIPVFNIGLNNRDHRKIISIDGKVAYTGGINITDEYANISSKRFAYWKDAGIRIRGNAVHSFTLMFLQMWNAQSGGGDETQKPT